MSEPKAFFRYWGKAQPEAGSAPFHLAAWHCLDVAAVAYLLCKQAPVLRKKLQASWRIPDEQVAATVAFWVAAHDLGKFDTRFQMKAAEVAIGLDPSRTSLSPGFGKGFDHGEEGYFLARDVVDSDVDQPERFSEIVAAQVGSWDNVRRLFSAVCAHHGEFPATRQAKLSGTPSIRRNDHNARVEWLHALAKLFIGLGAHLPQQDEPSQQLRSFLAGLCAVCDWIGSQTEFFSYCTVPGPLANYFDSIAVPNADRALRSLPLFTAVPAVNTSFTQLFNRAAPRGVQVITEKLSPATPSLVVIEAVMGEGKTEAALRLALTSIQSGNSSGIYIGLPTMATSNGMFDRIEQFATKAFTNNISLRLTHGRARRNDAFQRVLKRWIKPRASLSPAETDAQVTCSRWFLQKKRSLLADIGVGTVDQAMMAVLRIPHHFVRLFALGMSTVIIDEVHAYDAFMSPIIERLLHWLGALRTPVVLLSATLPAVRRTMLLAAYQAGLRGTRIDEPVLTPTTRNEYPLVTVASENAIEYHTPTSTSTAQKTVYFELLQDDDPVESVLRILVAKAQRGESVCWIRNTVKEAQEAFDGLNDSGVETMLFHARMRGCDRKKIEDRVLNRFSPNGARGGVVLVATQVVEQSLDLDFDFMVSDLCPIDLLLQRVGRLQRHALSAEVRKGDVSRPTCLVVSPTNGRIEKLDFGSSGYVYDPVSLWLAHDELRASSPRAVTLPDDLRTLIERTYDPVLRKGRIEGAATDPCGTKLRDEERNGGEDRELLRVKAERFCVTPVGGEGDTRANLEDDDNEAVHALTRDGDSTKLLLVRWDGELQGCELDALAESEEDDVENTPAWVLDSSAPGAWREADAIIDQLVSVPAYSWERIERGARPHGEPREWEEWETRCRSFLHDVGLHAKNIVIVPMRKRRDSFVGVVSKVNKSDSNLQPLRYSLERGLTFEERES